MCALGDPQITPFAPGGCLPAFSPGVGQGEENGTNQLLCYWRGVSLHAALRGTLSRKGNNLHPVYPRNFSDLCFHVLPPGCLPFFSPGAVQCPVGSIQPSQVTFTPPNFRVRCGWEPVLVYWGRISLSLGLKAFVPEYRGMRLGESMLGRQLCTYPEGRGMEMVPRLFCTWRGSL